MRNNAHIKMRWKRDIILSLLMILMLGIAWGGRISKDLHLSYRQEISPQITDRTGALLQLLPNHKGQYMIEATSSDRVRNLVVSAEDRYFYYHPGVNPVSTIRGMASYLLRGRVIGGSTITQQLVKNLLGNENERTLRNKIIELYSAFALEIFTSKDEILTMYLNTAYMGKQTEGIEAGSRQYFGKTVGELTDGEIVRLIAVLSAPGLSLESVGNTERASRIGERIGVTEIPPYIVVPTDQRLEKKSPVMFEVGALGDCTETCTLSVDGELTEKVREIVRTNLSSTKFASVANAVVGVIQLGRGDEPNHLLALVGTPNPYGNTSGSQINMALAPRPIGSTWKPFIYGKALEKGARPYTLIDDSEYRYEIGTGFAFYPKNYDGLYRGPVTLHYALANSLNVPAVRALQFDGIDRFSDFMMSDLGFVPKQSFDTYQLSVALGGLEMNPLLLANYFTIFPRNGVLAPLVVKEGEVAEIPMFSKRELPARIFAGTTTQLINKMLSDRLLGVEQFGIESNLDLPFRVYAVKTGTSYDYHDSWTIGYTTDVVVVVWIGNSDNTAMDLLSGARGAGKIWHDVMSLLYSRGDTVPRPFAENNIVDINIPEGSSFGLQDDDAELARSLMRSGSIILEPHNGDVMQYEEGMTVPLRATTDLRWSVNGNLLGVGKELFWTPKSAGSYILSGEEIESDDSYILRIRVAPSE